MEKTTTVAFARFIVAAAAAALFIAYNVGGLLEVARLPHCTVHMRQKCTRTRRANVFLAHAALVFGVPAALVRARVPDFLGGGELGQHK